METPSLATPTKKLGTLCLEDKENHQPEEKPTQKPDGKKVDKFPVPKIATDPKDDEPREPLSPKKGFKVNTSSMPAYMRATASSSVKKTNTKRNLTDKLKGPSSDSTKKTGIPSYRQPSERPGSSRPASARPGSTRPVSARPTSTRPVSARPNVSRPASSRVGSRFESSRVTTATSSGINKTPAANKTSALVRPPSVTPGTRKPISNLPNRPVIGRQQPKSSTNVKSRAASEIQTGSSKWDRLATPKQKTTSVRRPATDVKTVSKRPEIRPKVISKPSTIQKTKPNSGPKNTSTPAPKPPSKIAVDSPRTPQTPKNPTKLEAKETIGQKSCPAKPKQARRRTRFSVNNIELKENLKKWHESEMGQLVQNQKQFWNCLSNEDSKSATAKQVLEIVENTCQQLSNMKLPHNEKFAMMEELPSKFQFIEVKTFACYWKWYAELSIKCGHSKENVIEIIQKGKEEKAQPLKVLEDFFEQYLARLRDEPELGEGKQEKDPEMTLFHDLDDDEDLELSVVFDPPHDDVFNEPSPVKDQKTKANTDSQEKSPTHQNPNPVPETQASLMEQPAAQRAESTSLAPYIEPPTMEQSTIMNPRPNEQSMMVKTLIENNDSAGPDGSYFRFVVRKKKAAGDLVLTPVRRSKRNQAKTNTDGQLANLKEGDAIDFDDVNIEDGIVMDNHVTIIL